MTDWIIAISSSVTAITILVLWFQIRADHERARREKAVELGQHWVSNLTKSTSLVKILVESLDFEQAKAIYNKEPLDINIKHKEMLLEIFTGHYSNSDLAVKNGNLKLSKEQVSILRWEVISFLNSLETVFSAWRHNIADREIIMEEFNSLVSPESGHNLLQEFRIAAGSKATYPAIEEFAKEAHRIKSKLINGQSKIVP